MCIPFHSMTAFLFFLLVSAGAAQPISLGSSLTPTTNSSWSSPSGLYAFGFFPQKISGFAVGIFVAGVSDKTVVWTANRDNNPTVPNDVVLQLTHDGRLILQQREGQGNIDVINPPQSIASASMLDNGNFVLYNSDSRIIWQSFDHPTNTLLPGQRLPPDTELFSSASETDHSKGIFRMKMQTDGNLVQYPVTTPDTGPYAYYSSHTYIGAGNNNVSLRLENDGHLYVFNASSILRNLTRGGYPKERTIYLLRLDVGGICRLYSRSLNPQGNWTIRWSSTNDKCAPKGLCGFNAFCILLDGVANCQCLPGFGFVQSGNWTAGCTRNFTAESCREKDDRVKYKIGAVANTEWEDDSYDVFAALTEEDCGRACLDDCNCDAAFFKDRRCRKQRLPLRYARSSPNVSSVALLKLGTRAQETTRASDNSGSKKGLSDLQKYVIIGVSLGIAGLVISPIIVYYVTQQCRLHDEGLEINQNVDKFLLNHGSLAPKRYSYNEIKKITKSFTEKIGEGGYGIVYKGQLPEGQLVAVKVLTETHDNAEEFINEVASISRTSHINIVNLLGFCYDTKKRALVYEFMPNKSLDKFVYKSGSVDPECSLEWEKLYEIAVGVARGLEYLHRGCNAMIVHFDIKPQNILLDEDFCPKISDFGLAKLFKKKQSIISLFGARGTIGYIAPEVFSRNFGVISHKSDVYSYGMMLLEMAEARKIVEIEAIQSSENYFPDKIYEHVLLQIENLGDLIIEEKEEIAVKMLLAGFWCIQTAPSDRPSMTKVVEMLEGSLQSIQIPPKPFLSSPKLSVPQFSSSFSVNVVTESSTEGR